MGVDSLFCLNNHGARYCKQTARAPQDLTLGRYFENPLELQSCCLEAIRDVLIRYSMSCLNRNFYGLI